MKLEIKKIGKKLLSVAVVVAMSSSLAFAQGPKHMDKSKHKEMRKEVREYVKENIYPVIREKRQEFDQFLSEEEKKNIASYRTQLKELRPKMMELKKEMHKSMKSGDEMPQSRKEEMWILEGKTKEIIHKARLIAKAHHEELMKLKGEDKSQGEEWRKDLMEIKKKYMGEISHDKINKEHSSKGDFKHHRGHHKGHHRGGMLKKLHDPATFILMDPNGKMPSFLDKDNSKEESKIFPNPASSESTVAYTIKKSGMVKIELLNQEGDVIRLVENSHKEKGEHKVTTNVSNLESGTYFYRITSKKGVEMKRLLIK